MNSMNDITEPDWKLLRELKSIALERLCSRILQQVAPRCNPNGETSPQRFLKALSLIENGNDEIARAFDDLRRSNALERLRIMISLKLITDEELLRFSQELRSRLGRMKAQLKEKLRG
jgi:hypothetical protein